MLGKAKDIYHHGRGKRKAAKYCVDDKEFLKEKARNQCKRLSKEEKEIKRAYG